VEDAMIQINREKTSFIWIGMLALLTAGAADAEQKYTDQKYTDRALRDAACMRLDEIADGRGKSFWMLAEVTPSGRYKKIPAIRVDPGTGVIIPEQPVEAHIEEGTIACVTFSKKRLNTPFQYRWQYTEQMLGPNLGNDFQPFRDGPSLVVCRFNRAAVDEAKCCPNYLLPRDWKKWVAPAVEARRRHTGVPAPRPADAAALQEPNPLLLIDAFRRRTDDGNDQLEFALEPLGKNRDFLQAVLAYIFITSADGRPDAVDRVVTKVVAGATFPESLAGLALGAVAAEWDTGSDDVRECAGAILLAIRKQCESWRAAGKNVDEIGNTLAHARPKPTTRPEETDVSGKRAK
jgi:hypothetical protein